MTAEAPRHNLLHKTVTSAKLSKLGAVKASKVVQPQIDINTAEPCGALETKTVGTEKVPEESNTAVESKSSKVDLDQSKEQKTHKEDSISRLGMGISRVKISSAKEPLLKQNDEKVRAISSDQFNRDPDEPNLGQQRLKKFEGATSVSSSSFFQETNSDNSDDMKSPKSSYLSQVSPKELAVKLSSIDTASVREGIQSAGNRLSSYLLDLQNKYYTGKSDK
jgi:hypothetical protein